MNKDLLRWLLTPVAWLFGHALGNAIWAGNWWLLEQVKFIPALGQVLNAVCFVGFAGAVLLAGLLSCELVGLCAPKAKYKAWWVALFLNFLALLFYLLIPADLLTQTYGKGLWARLLLSALALSGLAVYKIKRSSLEKEETPA